MSSLPATANARRNMVAKIDGAKVSMDFQEGDELLFGCTVRLPKLDVNGHIVMKAGKSSKKTVLDNGIEVQVNQATAKMETERVTLLPGKVTAFPGEDADAIKRRWVRLVLHRLCADVSVLTGVFGSVSRLIGQPKGMKQVLMETGHWERKLKANCATNKKRKSPADVLKAGFEDAVAAGAVDASDQAHRHTKDCCQRGRLAHLTKGDIADRYSNTHLTKMTREAGYEIKFIPKYHCGALWWQHW